MFLDFNTNIVIKNLNNLSNLLTFNRHTSDWTSNDEIADQVRRRNNGRVLIHNVAFGSGADYEFMQQISAENEGIDRRIFENLDAGASVSVICVVSEDVE